MFDQRFDVFPLNPSFHEIKTWSGLNQTFRNMPFMTLAGSGQRPLSGLTI